MKNRQHVIISIQVNVTGSISLPIQLERGRFQLGDKFGIGEMSGLTISSPEIGGGGGWGAGGGGGRSRLGVGGGVLVRSVER